MFSPPRTGPLLTGSCFLLLLLSANAGQVLVKADTLSLREKPGSNEKRVDNLAKFDLVSLQKTQAEWGQIATKDGKSGWVLTKYLASTPFVTVDLDQMNVRRGPGETYDVIMKFTNHYPLRVLDRSEGWLKVADYEGDRGWVSIKNVTDDPYVITKTTECKVRSDGNKESAIAFTTEKGVVLKVIEEKSGWLKIKHQDGDEGWISAKTVFGWLESDGADKDKDADQGKAKDPKEQEKDQAKAKAQAKPKADAKPKEAPKPKEPAKAKVQPKSKDEPKAKTPPKPKAKATPAPAKDSKPAAPKPS